ncbi:MAG: ABC transporter permease, partial [Bacteroidota bacterium]
MNTLKDSVKIYFRRLAKAPMYYLVNIFGLTMGLVVFLFILLYVHDERQIDQFHGQSDRIFRVLERSESPTDGIQHWPVTANPLADALLSEFPEVEASARMANLGASVLKYGDRKFNERNYVFATSSLFDIWDFVVLSGDPKREFAGVAAIVLTASTAQRLFGSEDAVGKVIEMPNRFKSAEVIAVVEDLPKTSSFQFNAVYVTDFKGFEEGRQEYFDSWDSRYFTTWVLLKEGTTPRTIMEKKSDFLDKYFDDENRSDHDFYFQPISDLHLASSHLATHGSEPPRTIPYSSAQFVSIILIIGLGVLLIAALNYTNLSSVQALKRTLEAGIRKVHGASTTSLRLQLIAETFITTFLAYANAMAVVMILLPFFNEVTNKSFGVLGLVQPELLMYQGITLVAIVILSAIVPALYYSRLNRFIGIEKNVFSGKGELLRKVFITVQYVIALTLIAAVLVLQRQLNYIDMKSLGFTKDQVVTMDINTYPVLRSFKTFKTDLLRHPSITDVSVSSSVPGEWKSIPTSDIVANFGDAPVPMSLFSSDSDWLDMYQINLRAGTFFTGNDPVDSLRVVLNEKAVQSLGLENPIGQRIHILEKDTASFTVVGVMEDFHYQSLYDPIGPMALLHWNHVFQPLDYASIDYFSIRYNGNPSEVLAKVEEVNSKYAVNTPAELNFLDDQWLRFYEAERVRRQLFFMAALVAILISAIGLFGLINFTIERRMKELGIRKVLGAKQGNIVRILLMDYVLLLGLAVLVSFPFTYWSMSNWLASFAYRVPLGIGTFLLALVLVAFVSGSTVIFRILRAAARNPVRALRS